MKDKQNAHSELNILKKNVKMLNSGSCNLDSILGSQRKSENSKGIWFHGETSQSPNKFIKASGRQLDQETKKMFNQAPASKARANSRRKNKWIFHYCIRKGSSNRAASGIWLISK